MNRCQTETEDMKRFFAALMIAALPAGVSAETLSEVIATYVTDFEIVKLDTESRDTIRAIHRRSDLAHGMKVLLIHDELQDAGALIHADMHHRSPQPYQLSKAD